MQTKEKHTKTSRRALRTCRHCGCIVLAGDYDDEHYAKKTRCIPCATNHDELKFLEFELRLAIYRVTNPTGHHSEEQMRRAISPTPLHPDGSGLPLSDYLWSDIFRLTDLFRQKAGASAYYCKKVGTSGRGISEHLNMLIDKYVAENDPLPKGSLEAMFAEHCIREIKQSVAFSGNTRGLFVSLVTFLQRDLRQQSKIDTPSSSISGKKFKVM